MTIRDYLRKRRRIFWTLLFVCLTGMMLTGNRWPWLMLLFAVAGCALAVFMYQRGAACPRCGIGIEASMSISPRRLARPINFCPYCGVHLDEQVAPEAAD